MPPGFSHSLLNLPNFKNSFIFSSLNWLYSYWPSPEKLSADALGNAEHFVKMHLALEYKISRLLSRHDSEVTLI